MSAATTYVVYQWAPEDGLYLRCRADQCAGFEQLLPFTVVDSDGGVDPVDILVAAAWHASEAHSGRLYAKEK